MAFLAELYTKRDVDELLATLRDALAKLEQELSALSERVSALEAWRQQNRDQSAAIDSIRVQTNALGLSVKRVADAMQLLADMLIPQEKRYERGVVLGKVHETLVKAGAMAGWKPDDISV